MAKKKFSDEKTQITSVRQQPANFDSFERRPSKSFVCRLFLSTFAIRVIHLAFVVSYFPLLVWLLPPLYLLLHTVWKSPKKSHFEFSRQKITILYWNQDFEFSRQKFQMFKWISLNSFLYCLKMRLFQWFSNTMSQ